MRKRLLNNWGLKLISLVLAFLLWFLVVQIGDPKDDRDMGNIQVKLINTELLEKENKVYEIVDNTDTVRVTVYAPKSVFTQLRNSDITAEADVSKLTDINTIPIEFTASTSNVVSIKGSHDVVKLNIEDRASKYVPLVCSTVGTVANGYVVSNMTPDQNRIEVSGPKSAVEQVKYAGAQIDVTESSSNLIANVDIQLYDADGNVVERTNLVKNVEYVRMSVEILAMKEVPMTFDVMGTPAEGYMVAGTPVCEPATVQIAGNTYALNRVSEIAVPESELDVTDAKEDVVCVVDIREYLPENIKLADAAFNGKVTVTVPIEPIVEKTLQISMSDVAVTNVPEGFTIEISESAEAIVPLEVAGLSAQIEPLRQGGVLGVIDVSAWMQSEKVEKLKAGNYVLPVTFLLDEGITVKEPVKLKVVVKEKSEE